MNTTSRTDLDGSSDVTNLFEVYGAIDHHLEQDKPPEAEQVSRVLPIYKRPGMHWAKDFATTPGVPEPDAPRRRVGRALAELAKTNPRGRMRGRRLVAVSAAVQAFPDLQDRELAAAALGEDQLPEGADQRIEQLADRLRETPADSQAGRDDHFEHVVESELVPDGIGPRPCSGSLAWVKVKDDMDLVPTLKTVFEANLPYDAAREFCRNPETWTCFPSWCCMKEQESKNEFPEYQEIVSFNCNDDAFPKLKVNLNFSTEEQDTPTRRILTEYWLAPEQPDPSYVCVNQGWLEIEELPPDPYPRVLVTSTKSIMFTGELAGPGLASVLCRVGYTSMVGDLVTCASKATGEQGYPDKPFAGHPAPEGPQGAAGSADLGYGWLLPLMVEEAANVAETCIDEYVKATKGSYGKLGAGYTADDFVQDMVDNWLRTLRQGARVADASRRVALAAPRGRAQRPATPTRGDT